MSKADTKPEALEDRAEWYSRAAALLRRWLAESDQEDDGAYDWSAIENELETVAAHCRDSIYDDIQTLN